MILSHNARIGALRYGSQNFQDNLEKVAVFSQRPPIRIEVEQVKKPHRKKQKEDVVKIIETLNDPKYLDDLKRSVPRIFANKHSPKQKNFERNWFIALDVANGKTYSQISKELGLSISLISNVMYQQHRRFISLYRSLTGSKFV